MELRSRRSRSNTPIISTFSGKEMIVDGNHIEQTTVRTTRSTTKKGFISDGNNITNVGHFMKEETTNLPKIKDGKSNKAVRRSRYKTSDYSSEDGDQHISSSYSHIQNSTNEFIEEARRSDSRNSGRISALDFYRATGDYWNKVPKTDYTYSRHSRDRKEIAPGVVAMPNMSRKSLHDYNYSSDRVSMDKQTFTDEFDEYDYEETSKLMSKYNSVRPRNLFSSNSVDVTKSIKRKSIFNVFTSVFVTIFTWISSVFYYVYRIHNSGIIWLAKKIHKGTTRLMLWDTWLLRSFRNRSKLKSLAVLCLVPLLFLAGWWLLSGLGPLLYGAYFNNSRSPLVPEKVVVVENDEIISMESLKSTPDTEDIVAKIIQNPAIQDIIQKYNKLSVKSDYNSKEELLEHQQILIDNLREEINKIRFEIIELEKNRANEIARITAQLQSENAEKNARLTYQLNRCCSHSFVHIEKYVTKILKDLLGVPPHLSSQEDISGWIHSTFVAKQELEKRLMDLTRNLQSDHNLLIENNEKLIMDKVAAKISAELGQRIERANYLSQNRGDVTLGSLTDEHIKKIVLDSLAIYDADKTGLVDYALETAGGQILSTRCTESYQARTAVVSIFGIPLWYPTNTPRTVITAGLVPGECWAFQNFPGFLLIKLVAPVKIDMFSVEHISKLLVPNGKIDSAPKEFAVYGLRNETDRDPVLLGEYVYNSEGPPLQYFPVIFRGLVFNIVELRIHSNHGNPNYTCLYRFRVHGSLASEFS